MSGNVNKWSNVAVAVQTVIAAAKTLTAITKANPPVASSTAHGFVNGDPLLLKLEGMTELDYAVVRAAGVTADTFQIEGWDSTSFGTFVSGTAQKLTLGAQCATLQDVNPSGGEAEKLLVRTIHRKQDYNLPGNRAPLEYSFGSLWMPNDSALLALNGFDRNGQPCAVSFTFETGDKVFFAMHPSAPLAPSGNAGGLVSTPVSFSLRGPLSFYAGA